MENISENYKLTIMKELSVEEKAKAYDEALRYAMIYYKEGNEDMKMMMKTCFPALVEESEDERIRKELIEFTKTRGGFKQEWIAWLEKQGEQSSLNINRECLKGIKRVQEYQDLSDWEKEFDKIASMYAHNKNQEGYNDSWYVKERAAEMLYYAKKELEKQGGQKPTDEVGPITQSYIIPNGKFFQWIYDRLVHVHNENPDVDYMLSLKKRIEDMQNPANDDMKKALQTEYEKGRADAIAEIQKLAWSEKDEQMINAAISFIEHSPFTTIGKGKKNTISWLKSLKDRVQPKQEWSEEDEKEYKYVLKFVDNILNNCGNKKDYEHCKRCYDWLKSLKQKIGG